MSIQLEWAWNRHPACQSHEKVAHTAVKPLKHRRDPQDTLTVNSRWPASLLSGGRAILPLKSYVNININVTQQPLRQSSPGENGLGRVQRSALYLLTPQPWVRLLWPWCFLLMMAVKGCLPAPGWSEGSVTSAARQPGTQQVLTKCQMHISSLGFTPCPSTLRCPC